MSDLISRRDVVECVYKALRTPPLKGVFTDTMSLAIRMVNDLPSAQPERKDAIEKAVAVEAISDELMSRFDVSATYAYDFAEAAVNRIEVMAKELERGDGE